MFTIFSCLGNGHQNHTLNWLHSKRWTIASVDADVENLELAYISEGENYLAVSRASLVAQRLKRLPPMQETWVRSLGQEDPLEKEMVTHSSILAWRIPWMEKPGRQRSTGRKELDTTERLHL